MSRCAECGGSLATVAKAGRLMAYKGVQVELGSDVALPTCTECGEMYMDARDCERADASLEAAYQRMLRERRAQALERLSGRVEPRQVELMLGLPRGDLTRDANAAVVAVLALLADNPANLDTLRRFWTPAEVS